MLLNCAEAKSIAKDDSTSANVAPTADTDDIDDDDDTTMTSDAADAADAAAGNTEDDKQNQITLSKKELRKLIDRRVKRALKKAMKTVEEKFSSIQDSLRIIERSSGRYDPPYQGGMSW